MAGILTEQDTYFGSIAYRNKLITREQLSEGVRQVQTNPGLRLGDALVQLGYLKPDQIEVVLGMQKQQRSILGERKPPEAPAAPPVPQPAQAPPPQYDQPAYDPHAIELPEAPEAPTIRLKMPAALAAAELAEPEEESPPQESVEADEGEAGAQETREAEESVPSPDEQVAPKPSIASALRAAREALGIDDTAAHISAAKRAAKAKPEERGEEPAAERDAAEAAPEEEAGGAMGGEIEFISPSGAPRQEASAPRSAEAAKPEARVLSGGGVSLAAGSGAQAPSELRTLVDYLTYARAAGASDMHISAQVRPFMRRFSRIEPLDVPPLDAADTERLLFEVLSKEQKTILLEQRGLECCLDVAGQGRYRASIFKQRLGWDGVFHVIRAQVPTMEELGLPPALRRLTEYQQGLALVTGPGNSGKTTTLAAMVDAINHARNDHIITVESPVEYVHTPDQCQITQREVGVHTQSYSNALRAALREDPDIIMVGELRDLETLSMAITASETGHLVLGTLHTTSATSTINRILDGFPVPQQPQIRMMLSESLRGILSQQLVPRKDGRGQVLAMEILLITSAVSALIRDNQPHQIPSVMQTSRKIGMCRLDDSLMELAENEIIDGAEAYRRATNKQPFERFRQMA